LTQIVKLNCKFTKVILSHCIYHWLRATPNFFNVSIWIFNWDIISPWAKNIKYLISILVMSSACETTVLRPTARYENDFNFVTCCFIKSIKFTIKFKVHSSKYNIVYLQIHFRNFDMISELREEEFPKTNLLVTKTACSTSKLKWLNYIAGALTLKSVSFKIESSNGRVVANLFGKESELICYIFVSFTKNWVEWFF